MYSKTVIIGRLGADPEIKTFSDGGQIANIPVATWRNIYNKEKDDWETVTEWHRVVLKGKAALYLPDNLRKGDLCMVEGETKTRSFEVESGKRYITELVGILKAIPKPKQDSAMRQEAAQTPYQQGVEEAPEEAGGDDDLPF